MANLEFDGQKLKQLRKLERLTQAQVAEKVSKNASDIANYENGFATPPANTLLSLQQLFNADFAALSSEASEKIATAL